MSCGFPCSTGRVGAEFIPIITIAADEVGDFAESLVRYDVWGGHGSGMVGKNSSLAVSSCSGQGTPSRNERYAARVASAEKARLNVDILLAGVSTDICVHGITDVAEKIVFDGDGGKPKPPTSELDVVDEESDLGTEDDADADDSSGSSGSSGGGARMRSERAARDAALVTLPVPDVIVEVVPEYFSRYLFTYIPHHWNSLGFVTCNSKSAESLRP
jgi:hypothetical protein